MLTGNILADVLIAALPLLFVAEAIIDVRSERSARKRADMDAMMFARLRAIREGR